VGWRHSAFVYVLHILSASSLTWWLLEDEKGGSGWREKYTQTTYRYILKASDPKALNVQYTLLSLCTLMGCNKEIYAGMVGISSRNGDYNIGRKR
jgi:hypothetical protein